MKIAIYQINSERDPLNVSFINYSLLKSFQGTRDIRSQIYDLVYDGEVKCRNLEDVYHMFNYNMPNEYHGRKLSVSDIVEVMDGKEVKQGFYFCDSRGFVRVEFEKSHTRDKKN